MRFRITLISAAVLALLVSAACAGGSSGPVAPSPVTPTPAALDPGSKEPIRLVDAATGAPSAVWVRIDYVPVPGSQVSNGQACPVQCFQYRAIIGMDPVDAPMASITMLLSEGPNRESSFMIIGGGQVHPGGTSESGEGYTHNLDRAYKWLVIESRQGFHKAYRFSTAAVETRYR